MDAVENNLHSENSPAMGRVKFLIIRFSSIGDIVLTTPVIRCLKQQVQNADVHYLTKRNFAEIIESNPYVDKLFTLENSWELLMHNLEKENYHYIIFLGNKII